MNERGKGPESPGVDWGAIPQGEHFVLVYEDESDLLRALAGFTDHAMDAGAVAVVIATAAHLSSLRAQRLALGHDPDRDQGLGSYVALDAADLLSRFIVDGLPDPLRFEAIMDAIMAPARASGRPVHAFGEMVALLWAQGNEAATLALEHLWDDFCKSRGVTLFCAYPRIGATRDLGDSLAEACRIHARVLGAG